MNEEILNNINDLIANKEFETAKIQLEDFLKDDEFNVEALKLLGLCNINLKLYSQGQANFETVVKYKNDDATSWFYLGNCYDEQGDFLHAEAAYKRVIELRETYMDVYYSLAIVLLKTKQSEKALELAEKALEIEPENDKILYLIGTTYLSLKQPENSIAYLEKASELRPEQAQIHNNLGTAYLTLNQYDNAFASYQKAAELDETNSLTFFNLGSILQLQNKHQEACQYFEKAFKVEESDQYIISLALSEFKSAQYEKAIEHYQYLIERNPEKSNLKYNLASCYESTNELEKAIEIFEELVAANRKSVLMAQRLAHLYLKADRPEEAKEVYQHLVMQGSVTPSLYHEYAMICVKTGDIDTAERIFKKIIELDPKLANVHKDLGVIYLNKRLFDYAEDEFNTALELAPNDVSIKYELANFKQAINKNLDADKLYKEILEIEPENKEFLKFSAKNKMMLNDNEAAIVQLEKAIGNETNDDYLLFLLGKAYYMVKDYPNAKRYVISAYEKYKNVETENLLALIYYANGEFKQAAAIFNKVLEQNPTNTLVMMNLANCYEQLGENDKALEYAEKLVSIFAENEEAQEMIRRLS